LHSVSARIGDFRADLPIQYQLASAPLSGKDGVEGRTPLFMPLLAAQLAMLCAEQPNLA